MLSCVTYSAHHTFEKHIFSHILFQLASISKHYSTMAGKELANDLQFSLEKALKHGNLKTWEIKEEQSGESTLKIVFTNNKVRMT